MKFVSAIVKPFKLDAVRGALQDLGVRGLTVTECSGYGRQRGHGEIFRGNEYEVEFKPKLLIEFAVTEDIVERAVEAVRIAALTGKIGDGKIFVYDLYQVIRIRTGESGRHAL